MKRRADVEDQSMSGSGFAREAVAVMSVVAFCVAMGATIAVLMTAQAVCRVLRDPRSKPA
jgi:hypothetical protein